MHYQSKGGRKGILHCESWALHHNEGAGNAARVDTAQWLPCLDALAVVLDDILEHITSHFFLFFWAWRFHRVTCVFGVVLSPSCQQLPWCAW